MTPSERARRTRLWERYVLRGEPHEEVVSEVAAEFDVDEKTIREDLTSISHWLPRLDEFRDMSGVALLMELRANRQQLHQLADQARDAEDITQERKIREEINRAVNFERQLLDSDLKTGLTTGGKTVGEMMDDR
ncbi:hypothetical protein Htur_1253 [Haloterrigena turkmenica DSM 5511]|uniref:Uncharacterized protein n=1 Tax=Haloterrigena turkmenica (strain ATCC 51198 / DSM 5511 / JCM 9101 / NCIMB 13204 / VKM B-1734 / 4k) TaxID=543526 RepID=D2RPA9_HALTV|nr:hypothetical protein [Haloterrigena turkmenica]ADB60143.1 hypothetical protein Htur_1253 [Haloterrigena turkmenica DSM 5511]